MMQLLSSPRYLVLALLTIFVGAIGPVHAQTLRLEDLKQTRVRPLFSPSRQPERQQINSPPPKPIALTRPAAPAPDLLLIGIVLGTGEKKIIVKGPSDQRPLSLGVGENIDGWRVTTIEARAFVLENGGRSIRFTFPTGQPHGSIKSQQVSSKERALMPKIGRETPIYAGPVQPSRLPHVKQER